MLRESDIVPIANDLKIIVPLFPFPGIGEEPLADTLIRNLPLARFFF